MGGKTSGGDDDAATNKHKNVGRLAKNQPLPNPNA